MRSPRKADVAVIGGTGLETLLEDAEQVRVGTPHGLPPPISVGELEGKPVAFLPRHGVHHSLPPHQVNYRANLYALREMGVERILATNTVGAINSDLKPGDLVVPHDLVDFTRLRRPTFYDEAPVTHIDVSEPYCPEIRRLLVKSAEKHAPRAWDRAVLACTEGPRYETPAEIEVFRRLGCDLVGMTGAPEAVLARELEMCYAAVCLVSNMAAGMQQRLTAREVVEAAGGAVPVIREVLTETIRNLPKARSCPCADALKGARFIA